MIVSVANSHPFPCDVVKILGSDGIPHFTATEGTKEMFWEGLAFYISLLTAP